MDAFLLAECLFAMSRRDIGSSFVAKRTLI